MTIRTTHAHARHARTIHGAVVVSAVLWTNLPTFVSVANAQPAPANTTASPPGGQPAIEPATAPSGAAVAPPTAAVAAAPASEVAASGTAPTATAQTPAPPAAPQRDVYDGPPLLLTPRQKKPKMGGYGGLTVAYSRMLHRDGVLIGGEGALLIEHRLSLGAGGYGFSRTPAGPSAPDGTTREYSSGYGGFTLRYAVYSDIPIYASFGLLMGGGALTLAPHHHEDASDDDHDVEVRGYFVLQPDASLHVNMTRWLRLSLTAGYRIATGVDSFHLQADDVGGAVVGGNIQAGWF